MVLKGFVLIGYNDAGYVLDIKAMAMKLILNKNIVFCLAFIRHSQADSGYNETYSLIRYVRRSHDCRCH